MMLYHISLFSLITVLLFTSTKAWTESLSFDCYNYQINEVNEDQSYVITWSGNSLSSNCKIGFHAYDSSNILNDYKLCITATKWSINDRNVKLKYYTGFVDYLAKLFTMSSMDSPTTQWCSASSEYVDIELDTAFSGNYQGSLTLEVKGVLTYDYYRNMSWTVGGAIGGVVILSIIIVALIAVACRRRGPRTTMYGAQNTPYTIGTQYGTQQIAGGYPNQGYFTGPPSYNDVTKSNYPVGAPYSYPPPPSYQQYQTSGNLQQTTTETQEATSTSQHLTTETQPVPSTTQQTT